MFPHHQRGGRNSSALQIKQGKIFQTEEPSVRGQTRCWSCPGEEIGLEQGREGRRLGTGVVVGGGRLGVGSGPAVPAGPRFGLSSPRQDARRARWGSLSPARDEGMTAGDAASSHQLSKAAQPGKGVGGGPGALGTGEGSVWPDAPGRLRGERSRALGTVCPAPLRKH